MDKIIYEIDNLSIIKIVGGLGVILVAIIAFFSKIILAKINQQYKYNDDKSLQDLKGTIDKNNNLLLQLTQNRLNSSKMLIDKKITAYENMWGCIDQIKKTFPSSINAVYSLFIDKEFEGSDLFNKIDTNKTLGTVIKNIVNENSEIQLLKISENMSLNKPYLSDKAYLLYFCFNALHGRIVYNFCYQYKLGKIYNWKKDVELLEILKQVLSQKELEFIMHTQVNSLNQTAELIEYKILSEFRNNLFIADSTMDTIKYIEDLEKVFNLKN